MIHHVTRATRHFIVTFLIVVAVGLSALRIVLAMIDGYKIELERQIGAVIATPVQIGSLKARMHGLTPRLIVKDISVSGNDEAAAIKLDEIRLRLDLLDVLFKQSLQTSSQVTLVGAELEVEQREDGRFGIVGLNTDNEEPPLWLLQGGQLELINSRIRWRNTRQKAAPVTFDSVNLVLKNHAESGRHELHGLIKLPAIYGESVRISAQFDGNLFEPAQLNGQLYLEAYGLQWAAIGMNGRIPAITSLAGQGDIKIWSEWRRSQLLSATGAVDIQDFALGVKQNDTTLTADRASTRFNWHQLKQGWQLDIGDFILQSNALSSPLQFSLRVEPDAEGHWQRLALVTPRLELQEITRLLTMPELLPPEPEQWLKALNLTGRLDAFSLTADLNNKRFTLDGQFQDISFAAVQSLPGFSGLNGHIHGTEQRGWLQLNADKAQMTTDLFRQPLTTTRLNGKISWQQNAEHWQLDTQHLRLDAPKLTSHSRLRLLLPKNDTSPFLDLQTDFALADARLAGHYFPVGMMDAEVVSWLDNAFVAGQIPRGGLLVSGKLSEFPFTDGQGVFEVLFDAEQVELDYHPDWPHLTDLDAEVRFWSESLTVDVHQAKTLQCTVKQTTVTIPSFAQSDHVQVQGQAEGRIANILGFLQQTPLKPTIDPVRELIKVNGNSTLSLNLAAPLTASATIQVDGFATLNKAELNLKAFDLPVSGIKGTLKFNEHGIFAQDLSAQAFAYPVSIQIESQPDNTVIHAAGRVGINDLQQRLQLPAWTFANGASDYRLALALPYDKQRSPELSLHSNLQGVALTLPGALAKTGEQERPLALTIKWRDEPGLPILLNYDNTLKAAITLDTTKQTLISGHFLYGQGQAVDPEQGIVVTVERERVRLEDWWSWFNTQGDGAALAPDRFTIHVRHLLNNDQDLGALNAAFVREPTAWLGTIDSPAVKGQIQVPYDLTGTAKIKWALHFIDFSLLSRLHLKSETAQAQTLPLFDIVSEKTFWRSVELGRLDVETERIPTGLAFTRISLTGKKTQANLTGIWTTDATNAQTQLQGHISSPQFGRLLTELGFYDEIKETYADSDVVLNWPGAPYRFALAGLSGQLDVKLKNGRLASIEPGFGRVLGILAFAQWGKRLQLDFRDIYKEGLSFDSIRGRITIDQGIARTDDLVINAVPAKISLIGTANLIDRTLDQWLTVVPKSSDAVPIAGTIVGRIAGLVARAVTDDYKEGYFFGSEYQVKGPWQNPEIIPLHENDGLFQKTWQGITDFPWLDEKEQR